MTLLGCDFTLELRNKERWKLQSKRHRSSARENAVSKYFSLGPLRPSNMIALRSRLLSAYKVRFNYWSSRLKNNTDRIFLTAHWHFIWVFYFGILWNHCSKKLDGERLDQRRWHLIFVCLRLACLRLEKRSFAASRQLSHNVITKLSTTHFTDYFTISQPALPRPLRRSLNEKKQDVVGRRTSRG